MRNKHELFCLFVITIIWLSSCASTSLLPKSSDDIDFNGDSEGKTGWSQYKEKALFYYDLKSVMLASKSGLADAGFALNKFDVPKLIVVGEHGITLHDWNVVAGIYFKEIEAAKIEVLVIVEGSKDFGVSGDVTSDSWSGKILKGMREYLAGIPK